MKIAFTDDGIYGYAQSAPWAVGGAERYQWLLARALAAKGWSVCVGVRDHLSIGERRRIDEVEFVGIGQGQILLAWNRFLQRERPGYWHWHCASHLWGPAVALAKLRHVTTLFSAMFDTDVQPRQALVWRRRWWWLYAAGLLGTDVIFVQHNGQARSLAPSQRAKAVVLPGVVSQGVGATPHAKRRGYVVWAAMLRQPKRPDLLIEIARKLPSVRFVVCGGPSRHRSPNGYGELIVDALHKQPNIDYRGQTDPEKALEVIAGADILLSTSDQEGFPSTFLEAWANGTPVVSLRVDPDHIIEREGLGLVTGNQDKAVRDIHALIQTPHRRDSMGAAAQRYVAAKHSEAAVVSVFESALQNLSPPRWMSQ